MNAFTTKPLGIETLEDADCFKNIHRDVKPRLRPWVRFAIRNTLITVCLLLLGALGVWLRGM